MEFGNSNRAGMIHCWNEASGVQRIAVCSAGALRKRFKEQSEVWKTSWRWVTGSLPSSRWKGLVRTKGLTGVRPTPLQVPSLPSCRLPGRRKRMPAAFWGRSALCWTWEPGAAACVRGAGDYGSGWQNSVRGRFCAKYSPSWSPRHSWGDGTIGILWQEYRKLK